MLHRLWRPLSRPLAQICLFTSVSSSSSSSTLAHICRRLSSLASSPIRLQPPSASPSPAPAGTLLGRCQHLACVQPSAGMKTKSALKRRCRDCFIVRRRGRLFVFCKTNPRHKQRQG